MSWFLPKRPPYFGFFGRRWEFTGGEWRSAAWSTTSSNNTFGQQTSEGPTPSGQTVIMIYGSCERSDGAKVPLNFTQLTGGGEYSAAYMQGSNSWPFHAHNNASRYGNQPLIIIAEMS